MAIFTRFSSGESGLTLIRFGLGSYFLAVASGAIIGVNPGAALALVLPGEIATFVGTAALLGATVLLMAGRRLAVASVMLAGLVLTASLAQNLLATAPGGMQDISALWRDIALVCAVILTQQVSRLMEAAPDLEPDAPSPEPSPETRAEPNPDLWARVTAPEETQPEATPATEAARPAMAQAPGPMPRRVADIRKARTPRPNLPKVRKLSLDHLAPASPAACMPDEDAPDHEALHERRADGDSLANAPAPADADPRFGVVPRKICAKTIRARFKPLPLTSPYDHPHENIFAQI